MAGMFDDLIPQQQGAAPSAPSSGGGLFDDLIPQSSQTQEAAPESWGDYATGLAQKAASGATFGFGDELAASMGSLFGLGPMIGGKSYDQILSDVRGQERSFDEKHPIAATASEIAGSIPTAIGAGAVAKGLPLVGKAVSGIDRGIGALPGWVTRGAVRGGALGAPYGAVASVGKSEGDKSLGEYADVAKEGALEGAKWGALLTPGLEGAGRAVANTIGPWASKEAQNLISRGVPLTPGETLGGVAKWSEDMASRLPLTGGMVRSAQQKSTEGLNRAAAAEALEPIGGKLGKDVAVGHEAVQEIGDQVSNAYARSLAGMQGVVDIPLQQRIADIKKTIPAVKRAEFDDAVQRNLMDIVDPETGMFDGAAFKHIEGAFNKEAADLVRSQSSSAYDRMLGKKLFEVREAVLDMAGRHNPPEMVKGLKDANEAFSRLARLERAGSSVAAQDGVFTAAQLHNAVKASDKSARKGQFARGKAKMQDLSSDAKKIMSSTAPNSGTAERLAFEGLIHGGALYGGGLPALGATAGATAAIYNPVTTAMIRKLATGGAKSRAEIKRIMKKLSTNWPVAYVGSPEDVE